MALYSVSKCSDDTVPFGCTIVHPESFRSNAQNAIAFACRNLPRVNRSGEFASVYLRLRALTCDHTHVNSI